MVFLPDVNSDGTSRNVPPLLSHGCPSAGRFDGYEFIRKIGKNIFFVAHRQENPRNHAGYEDFSFSAVFAFVSNMLVAAFVIVSGSRCV